MYVYLDMQSNFQDFDGIWRFGDMVRKEQCSSDIEYIDIVVTLMNTYLANMSCFVQCSTQCFMVLVISYWWFGKSRCLSPITKLNYQSVGCFYYQEARLLRTVMNLLQVSSGKPISQLR